VAVGGARNPPPTTSKINKVNKIFVQLVFHTTKQRTAKSHLHSFTLFNIIGSSIVNNAGVIKTAGGRSFLFHDFCDFNINHFFNVGPRNSFDGRILSYLFFL
jgi:hypothetical protein